MIVYVSSSMAGRAAERVLQPSCDDAYALQLPPTATMLVLQVQRLPRDAAVELHTCAVVGWANSDGECSIKLIIE